MKKYIIYNDVHKFGPHHEGAVDLLADADKAIYLGDNIDMNHVKKKELTRALAELKGMALVYKERFCPGNHELDLVPGPRSYVDEGICFEHGDYLFWGLEKRSKYMASKTPGAGFFVRFFIIATLDHLRKIWPASYSKEFKERAFSRAVLKDCHTIVVGHKHPTKMADFNYRGIRIIVLPRGRNEIEL